MTVTKGKQLYKFPSTSANSSDNENIDLGRSGNSDTESLHNEPLATTSTYVPRPVHTFHVEDLLALSKHSGKRKLRRYQNRCTLQTLDEEEDGSALTTIMENYESPFAKLLNNNDALDFWNIFNEMSETEQAQIIDGNTKNQQCEYQTADKPLSRISTRIRRTFKVRKNLSMDLVRKCEQDLIDFFKISPKKVYAQCPPNYFERLLLHAIAQYHNLKSQGLVENGTKKVEVYNSLEWWTPVERCLSDIVAQLRHS